MQWGEVVILNIRKTSLKGWSGVEQTALGSGGILVPGSVQKIVSVMVRDMVQ